MYSLDDYGSMIADKVRMDPYAYALKAAIKPESVVLDIGAATGIHALLAAKFGARKVYAIESNEAIHLARQLAEANGFADRIKFIQAVSTHVTLPERANVIVSDLRGVLPLFGNHILSIMDARQRHLAPGGTIIPRRDSLWVALVEAPRSYNEMVKPWDRPFGLNMEDAKHVVLNSWSHDNSDIIGSRELLTEPIIWAILDYASISEPDVGGSNMFCRVTRDGTAYGLLIWFDAELAEGIGFSNGPQAAKFAEVYGRGFFPLLEPVSVAKGDTITLDIRAEHINGAYVWSWHTRILEGEDATAVKADFKQSTSYRPTTAGEGLEEVLSAYRPTLGEEGKIDLFILGMLDGRNSLELITRQTMKQFPAHFQNQNEALTYVYELAQQAE